MNNIIKKTYDDFTPFYNLCLNNLSMKESSTYLYYEIVDTIFGINVSILLRSSAFCFDVSKGSLSTMDFATSKARV